MCQSDYKPVLGTYCVKKGVNMLSLVGAVSLLANVAKVDIRATGTPTEAQQSVLKATLMAAYAGAGLTVTAEHMTVHTGTEGSTVIEVTGTSHTNEQIDGYWCVNDPLLRNSFKDLAVMNTGLSDVTDVHTCTGPSGEGCSSSTPCGGGGDVDDDGTPDPAPEPEEPESTDGGGDDDGNGGLSTLAIVFIILGALIVLAVLLYILWPAMQTLWAPPPSPMVSSLPMQETVRVAKTGSEAFLAGHPL